MKSIFKKVALKSRSYDEEGERLKVSLKKSPKSIKDIKETSSLKDEVMAAFDHYFDREKEHVAFFYPNLDLSQMDLLKVVRDAQLVADE